MVAATLPKKNYISIFGNDHSFITAKRRTAIILPAVNTKIISLGTLKYRKAKKTKPPNIHAVA